jgi:hypothetical protein
MSVTTLSPLGRSVRYGRVSVVTLCRRAPRLRRSRDSKGSGPFPHDVTSGGGRHGSNAGRKGNRKAVGRRDDLRPELGWSGGPGIGAAGPGRVQVAPRRDTVDAVTVVTPARPSPWPTERNSVLASPGSRANDVVAGHIKPSCAFSTVAPRVVTWACFCSIFPPVVITSSGHGRNATWWWWRRPARW